MHSALLLYNTIPLCTPTGDTASKSTSTYTAVVTRKGNTIDWQG